MVADKEGDVLGDGDPQRLGFAFAAPTRGPVAGDHHEPLGRVDQFEDDLEDVARLVAQVHDMRARLNDAELAPVERERNVDAAQVAGARRILDDLEVAVAGLGEQLGEHVVALDLSNAEELRPLAAVSSLSTAARLAFFAA